MKLLLPWRFCLRALTNGLDPLEGITRCIENTYPVLAFWRTSNLWIIRWYTLLGGT
jgi:hypothetical protein